MLNKKGLTPLILEIIGGVIVVALVLILFAGFSAPFLEFLSDSKNIESFNKFTNAMGRSCREGSETVSYFVLGFKSAREVYATVLVNNDVASAIKRMQDCEMFGSGAKCITQKSRAALTNKCTDGVCWCLMKIKYMNTGKSSPYCANSSFNALSVNSSKVDNLNDIWFTKLKNDLSSPSVLKVDVLICSNVQKDIGCNTTIDKRIIPVLPKTGVDSGYLVWLQPNILEVQLGGFYIRISDLVLDSISFDRPVSGGNFVGSILFTSNPNLRVAYIKDKQDTSHIWSENCPLVP